MQRIRGLRGEILCTLRPLKELMQPFSQKLAHNWYGTNIVTQKFTDRGKIKRQQKGISYNEPSCNTQSHPETSGEKTILRSPATPTNSDLCLFCQDESSLEKMSSFSTFKTSEKIIQHSEYDHRFGVRLSLVSHLIASEGKYLYHCYITLLRTMSKVSVDTATTDLAVISLVKELQHSAEEGHVLELSEVFKRYCTISAEAGTVVKQYLTSRLRIFKDKLLPFISSHYDFISCVISRFLTDKPLFLPLDIGICQFLK